MDVTGCETWLKKDLIKEAVVATITGQAHHSRFSRFRDYSGVHVAYKPGGRSPIIIIIKLKSHLIAVSIM